MFLLWSWQTGKPQQQEQQRCSPHGAVKRAFFGDSKTCGLGPTIRENFLLRSDKSGPSRLGRSPGGGGEGREGKLALPISAIASQTQAALASVRASSSTCSSTCGTLELYHKLYLLMRGGDLPVITVTGVLWTYRRGLGKRPALASLERLAPAPDPAMAFPGALALPPLLIKHPLLPPEVLHSVLPWPLPRPAHGYLEDAEQIVGVVVPHHHRRRTERSRSRGKSSPSHPKQSGARNLPLGLCRRDRGKGIQFRSASSPPSLLELRTPCQSMQDANP
ncbi:uncharacterized protein LOC141540907 [Sminthopsis crassicaudata]|uniref:uncharacterized protein LOC141540907 n=1 Tax=Sminthopsis crassicaudata TaxID=9301 RepID=UPI003D684555